MKIWTTQVAKLQAAVTSDVREHVTALAQEVVMEPVNIAVVAHVKALVQLIAMAVVQAVVLVLVISHAM